MKDERIKYRTAERRALIDHGVRAFCLTSGNLNAQAMADCFIRDQDRIWTEAARTGPALFAVSRHDIREIELDDLTRRRSLARHNHLPHTLCTSRDRIRPEPKVPGCPLARSAVLDLRVRTVSSSSPATCLRCGAPLPPPAGVGRTRLWCSGRCRKAAYEARRSARQGAVDVIVERVVVQEHNLTECAARVSKSPAAVRRMLHELRRLASERALLDDLKWQPVLLAYEAIGDAIALARGQRRR
jgi:hypothetical protein